MKTITKFKYLLLVFVLMANFASKAQVIEATSAIYSFNIQKKQTTLSDIKPPVIEILYPLMASARGFKPVVEEKLISLKGRASDESGIYEVKVNGADVRFLTDGTFTHELMLVMGDNLVVIEAIDGKANKQTLNLTIQRSLSAEVVEETELIVPELITTKGKYYALIIGVQDYVSEDITDLEEPISDAQNLYNVLTQQYTFDRENVKFMKNPSREDIIVQLDYYVEHLSGEDNLLIFYAGHGYWDEKRETGYWLPADAQRKSTARWLRNSTIQEYIDDIKVKHTLLIADACFSGSIYKTRKAFEDAPEAVNKLYDLSSRKAITSGTLTEVPDKSVFMEYFLKNLNNNTSKYVPALDMFSSFRTAVMNNSPNTPQYGTIQNTGDEGGDFIFIRR
jgi:hypothetical protein